MNLKKFVLPLVVGLIANTASVFAGNFEGIEYPFLIEKPLWLESSNVEKKHSHRITYMSNPVLQKVDQVVAMAVKDHPKKDFKEDLQGIHDYIASTAGQRGSEVQISYLIQEDDNILLQAVYVNEGICDRVEISRIIEKGKKRYHVTYVADTQRFPDDRSVEINALRNHWSNMLADIKITQ